MSPVSSLVVPDSSDEAAVKVNITKPNIIGYFTTSKILNEFSEDICSLKYFNNKLDLKQKKLLKQINENNIIKPVYEHNVKYSLENIFTNWIDKSYTVEGTSNQCVIFSTDDVISQLMNTPFQIFKHSGGWRVQATVKNNNIYLLNMNSVHSWRPSIDLKWNDDEYDIHFERMKNNLFVKEPEEFFSKVNSILDKSFHEVYQLNVGKNRLVYTTEIPGVRSEQAIRHLDDLKSADHIAMDLIKSNKFAMAINNNPYWWSKVVLINAQYFIIGFYNESSQLFDIVHLPSSKLTEFGKLDSMWSPAVAWTFLNDFLTFVRTEIEKFDVESREKYYWNFFSKFIKREDSMRQFIFSEPYSLEDQEPVINTT